MAEALPTFEYDGDQILATFEGRVIASGDDFAKVSCSAEEYLNGLRKQRKAEARAEARRTATHITTPNGLRGEVLSRAEGVWGSDITVRFENGQIRHFETAAGSDPFKYSKEASEEPQNLRELYQRRLAVVSYLPSREGLTARLAELSEVRREVAALAAAESSISEQQELHQLVLSAEAETAEVQEALAHLEAVDAESAAPAPPTYSAVEQADLGRAANDSWLDVVAHEMIAESEAQDLDKLLAEGPTVLVSGLGDAAIHDAGTVRETASKHIVAKTAGFQGEAIAAYREQFVANAEQARRQELQYRQQETRKGAKKTAKKDKKVAKKLTDEFLFGAE